MRAPQHALLAALVLAGACDRSEAGAPTLDRQAMLDPGSCQGCHPDAYREWSGSMHAYAADDPVFIAMNRRGQRETGGALGDFCVRCHAPVALQEGLTKDGLNIAELPQKYKGVTCYFCHSIASVEGTHTNPLRLADDLVMRGPIRNPVATRAHASGYSAFLDSGQGASATACGACHDIVNPKGAHVERTFAEWQGTLVAKPPRGLTCAGCHMPGRNAPASSVSTVERRIHGHAFPGVDVALTPWPETDAQRAMVQAELDLTLQGAICVNDRGSITVSLENVAAGHHWPSGATPDRRAWVELVAYAGEEIVYQSGVVPDGRRIERLEDPDLWLIRDCLYDERGQATHKFWGAARFTSNQLPGIVTTDPRDPASLTHLRRTYPGPGRLLDREVDRVTMRVRLRPIGDEILDELVASGDLDPAIADRMPTFDLASTRLEWTRAKAEPERDERNQLTYCVASTSSFRPALKTATSHARCGP